ncbi:GatB/YqeY domain-containing protein [bacterium]|nr:GatB/YqeY domain-containing protein [bacterium]
MIAQIRKDWLTARKEKRSAEAALLSTLVSEITMVGKNDGNRETTKEETLKIIKKFLQNVEEIIKIKREQESDAAGEEQEKEWLVRYLPKQMSEDELVKAIQAIVEELPEKSMKVMGAVMGQLQKKYAGLYDGKSAAKLVKQALMS